MNAGLAVALANTWLERQGHLDRIHVKDHVSTPNWLVLLSISTKRKVRISYNFTMDCRVPCQISSSKGYQLLVCKAEHRLSQIHK
jgi:hypothetical protein